MPEPGHAGPPGSFRAQTYTVIFGTSTPWGKTFDVVLMLAILTSVAAVMLDSAQSIQAEYATRLTALEFLFTGLFTVEYGLRVWSVRRTRDYVLSPFGIIDLISVLPTYLSLLFPGGQILAVIRVLRVMRVFRVLKLVRYVGEASVLMQAVKAARFKIAVFVLAVLCIVVVVGSLMYIVEGASAGFTSIPRGVYWAVVTLTTVGYGDIAPVTALGQALASVVMIMGYGIIAVPTGIITAELALAHRDAVAHRLCEACGISESDTAAKYCRRCGHELI
jgi:voltage-gated potassium channel